MKVCPSDNRPSRLRKASLGVALMMLMSMSPALVHFDSPFRMETGGGNAESWIDGDQPWPQSGRTPDRVADVPAHSPEGGAGNGTPADATDLMSIVEPVVNWVYGSPDGYSYSTDALATPVADLSASVTKDEGSSERCGGSSLYTILVQTDENSDHTYLRIVEGEDADLAWEVDMGLTEYVKAAPVVVDVNDDGIQEVLVAYDAAGTLYLDAWSPELSCSVTGWSSSGDSSQLLWSWSDESLMISGEATSFTNGLAGNKPTTQPLLADLDLDGDAEMIIAAIDEVSDEPVVVALGLSDSGASLLWEAALDRGSHPSDPAFAQTDPTTGYVLLTTTQEASGAMWVWKLDSDTGDSNWDGLTLGNSDGDTEAPHIRLPGPIIAELNGDTDDLEMILTIPTDVDGFNGQDGAEFVGMEIGTGDVLWSFEASNGYADAPPVATDTNGDGQHDRVCWVTWSQETTGARHGYAGCHDVSGSNPDQAWQKNLEQSSGGPNDEIAVAPPTWMDLDGSGEQELLVAYGRTLWAFDGDDGSTFWGGSIELPHKTWSAPALADIDGDATLDLVLGDTVVSHALADIRPLLDQRSIEFSPSEPNPGEIVTVTALFENSGTADTDHEAEAKLYANGQLIASYEAGTMEPADPTGSGSFESFSIDWSGPLGEHVFELILDPYSNVSQSRRDNDAQTTTLAIMAPYNATFEIPTEPIRVTPGESTLATPIVRSTGRLSGTWSLTVDDASLPEGWSVVDETVGGLTGVEIGVNAVWTPHLRIHAPAESLGSDAGYLGLALTLDEDPGNVSVSASLPLEANRTRGLSLRGPDGTGSSIGYGLLGTDAQAWMLLHNLGNAAENQITISWDGTAWGSDLRLYDMDGTEQPAISLSADEKMLLTARMEVPSDAVLGEYVSTPFTMCVGSGEEETCQTLSLTFEASGVITDVHQRSVPASGLQWEVRADMPPATSQLSWSLSDAGMAVQGWSWSATGDLSIVGDSIFMTGVPDSLASGTLTLDLPENAPPAFHSFSDASVQSPDHVIRLSLEVLQIHRASIEVTSPTEQPHVAEVGEEVIVMVRLENQGNGQDTYHLTHDVVLDENISEDPGVGVSFSNDMVSLGAGGLTNIPVTLVLPPNTPAGTPISIIFHMTSLGDQSVSDSDTVALEARQDHRWNLTAYAEGGSEAEGRTFAVAPGEVLIIDINATNVGNLIDGLELKVTYNVSLSEGDGSQSWNSSGDSVTGIEVNQSAQMTVQASVPEDAWNGSVMSVSVTAEIQGEVMESFGFNVEVSHVPGWSVVADQANLEVEPEGSSVELSIIQLGNSPSEAYATVWVSGESGWDIEIPDELPVLAPGQSAPMTLNITPPETAQHGRAVELHIRLREGDGSGEAEITLPLRVAVFHNFSLTGGVNWVVSTEGGHPLAELRNLGNAPTTIDLQVLSLPLGWTVSGQMEVVLGVNEVKGVPIEVIPSTDWDGSVQTIRILAEDSAGNQREVSLDTEQSEYSWASSPIIVAVSGDYALIGIHGTDFSSSVIDSATGLLEWHENGGWELPTLSSGSGSLDVGGSTLTYSAHITEPSLRTAVCSIQGEIGEVVAQCSVLNGSESFSFTILLIDDEGVMLDSFSGNVAGGSSFGPINLSATDWNPEPGTRILALRLLDDRGIEIVTVTGDFDIRRTDWNIGLVGLELDGEGPEQQIRVLTKRGDGVGALFEQYNADCSLSLVSGDYSMVHQVDLTGTFSPTVEIDRPPVVDDGDEIVVTIGCAFPWDVDFDSSDDESRLILAGGITEPSKYPDMGTSLAAAMLVIGVSVAMAWIVRNYREGKELMEMAMAAAEEKMVEQSAKEIVEDESEEQVEEQVEETGESPESESNPEDSPEDDFEARLKRLMRD